MWRVEIWLPPLVGMNAAGWKAKILNPGLAGQTCRVAFGSSGKLAAIACVLPTLVRSKPGSLREGASATLLLHTRRRRAALGRPRGSDGDTEEHERERERERERGR